MRIILGGLLLDATDRKAGHLIAVVLRVDIRCAEGQVAGVSRTAGSRRPEAPDRPTIVERTISPKVVASKGNGQRGLAHCETRSRIIAQTVTPIEQSLPRANM